MNISVMASPTTAADLNWKSATIISDQATSSLAADTRLQNQSSRAKIIGPFDGDNNNNDEVIRDQKICQKNTGSMTTDIPAPDLAVKKTNRVESNICAKPSVTSASDTRECAKNREASSLQHHRKSIPQAHKEGCSKRSGLRTDVQRGMNKKSF